MAKLAFDYCSELESNSQENAKAAMDSLQIFSERLLTPAGPAGFRITTKIHPFWNLYFNGLGVSIAEAHERERSNRVHSYRFAAQGEGLFDRGSSWIAFREASIGDCAAHSDGAVVVQTDISSFYEHVNHHRIQNCVADLSRNASTVPIQVDRLLSKFSSSDYRQIVMYWLLTYAAAVERGGQEWSHGILINPRLNYVVQIPFDEIVSIAAGGRSKVELLQAFAAMVGDYAVQVLA